MVKQEGVAIDIANLVPEDPSVPIDRRLEFHLMDGVGHIENSSLTTVSSHPFKWNPPASRLLF
jgi:hypothetical protein